MKNLTRHDLTIGELFGLDRITEQNSVERVGRAPLEDGGPALYLFRCDGLLPEAQQLAIDDRRGMIGVYQEHVIVNEIPLKTMEIYVLTALVLSFPFSVNQSQIQDLYKLRSMNEMKQDPGTTQGDDDFMNPIHDLVSSCNERLRSLGLAITSNDAAYQLVAVSEEKQ